MHVLCWLSGGTKQYPIRKWADRRRRHYNRSHGAAQSKMDMDIRDGGSACRFVAMFSQKHSKHSHSNFFLSIVLNSLFWNIERFCEISCFSQSLVENVYVCGVLSSSHRSTPHTIGAKLLNLGLFVLMFVVSHILKILWDFKYHLVWP